MNAIAIQVILNHDWLVRATGLFFILILRLILLEYLSRLIKWVIPEPIQKQLVAIVIAVDILIAYLNASVLGCQIANLIFIVLTEEAILIPVDV